MGIKRSKIKQSPKLPAQQRRRQLLAAASELFVKRGYNGTTIDQIARQSGVTKGAVYFHFGRKEDILLELVRGHFDGHLDLMKRTLANVVEPAEMFRRHLAQHLECGDKCHGEMADIWVQAWRIPRIRRYISRRTSQMVKLFEERLAHQELPRGVNSRDLIVFMHALINGLSSTRLVNPGLVDAEVQCRLFESMLRPVAARSRLRKTSSNKSKKQPRTEKKIK